MLGFRGEFSAGGYFSRAAETEGSCVGFRLFLCGGLCRVTDFSAPCGRFPIRLAEPQVERILLTPDANTLHLSTAPRSGAASRAR
jgi:hypothetical protein